MLARLRGHLTQGTLKKALRVKKNQLVLGARKSLRGTCRNIYNITRYGPAAPRFGELLWVDPRRCTYFLDPAAFKSLFGALQPQFFAGAVIRSSAVFDAAVPVEANPTIKKCLDRWLRGVPWEETEHYRGTLEAIARGEGGGWGSRDPDDLRERHRELDRIFEQVKAEGAFELNERAYRHGRWHDSGRMGLLHLDPRGELCFGGDAWTHRFAIAYALNIPFPALLGCVHVAALGRLPALRRQSRILARAGDTRRPEDHQVAKGSG